MAINYIKSVAGNDFSFFVAQQRDRLPGVSLQKFKNANQGAIRHVMKRILVQRKSHHVKFPMFIHPRWSSSESTKLNAHITYSESSSINSISRCKNISFSLHLPASLPCSSRCNLGGKDMRRFIDLIFAPIGVRNIQTAKCF